MLMIFDLLFISLECFQLSSNDAVCFNKLIKDPMEKNTHLEKHNKCEGNKLKIVYLSVWLVLNYVPPRGCLVRDLSNSS